MAKQKKMVHCGLFGHVDSGKTAIASVLSEIVSTAGLDAHPQAKKRGISIDLGFTSFDLNGYQIALVDAPGHADLIRSVVASAGIIDVAILVIDAVKGPELQTGEHMIVLESLNIKNVLVAVNKIDLIHSGDADFKIDRVRDFLKKSGHPFNTAPIIPLSAKENVGFDNLRNSLIKIIDGMTINRPIDDPFYMPFDHHFQVKGFGTIITGTLLAGTIKVGDRAEISPLGLEGKVKSIHVFKEERTKVEAGERAGIAIPGIDSSRLYRGCILSQPRSVSVTRDIIIQGQFNSFFKHALHFKSQVHVTSGMATIPSMIYPFERISRDNSSPVDFVLDEVSKDRNDGIFSAFIHTVEPIPVKTGWPLLISRLDLPPSELRIAARATVESIITNPPILHKLKVKTGRIKDQVKGIVEGLASSIEGARRMVGRKVIAKKETDHGIDEVQGQLFETFGTKGNLRATFDGSIPPSGTPVVMSYPKEIKLVVD